jgi:hypothetical protein
MPSNLERAKPKIRARLQAVRSGVFTEPSLRGMVATYQGEWHVAKSLKRKELIGFLVDELGLRVIELRSERYGKVVRYAWSEYSPYAMALTLRPRSYLSHGTGVFLNGLNEQLPKTIYMNQEQSKKPARGTLSQSRLDMAFSRRQRTSSYVFNLESLRVVVLSGKQTGRLGVVSLKGSLGEELPVTGIERTLIDIVVRPAYAGGIQQVLEAYRGARERADVGKLVRMLSELDYVYPYHQAIGFLMERAGYSEKEWMRLRRLGIDLDFYLVHGMKNPQHDPRWRLFFPQGM